VVLLIVVKVSTTGITVDGHADYAETGNDIICAAVSALSQSLIRSFETLTDDRVSYRITTGHMDISYKNLSEKGKLLVDSFFIAVSDIQHTYGDAYVQVQ
jgi:uncharacterized protein YsxB (DUF464 family)